MPQSALPWHPAQTPLRQAGSDPVQTAHPGGEVAVPQCVASLAEQARHAPVAQYFPFPQEASAVHTQVPAWQTGVCAVHTAHPAGAVAVPQRAASVGEHDWQAPEPQYFPGPQEPSAVHTHAPAEHVGVAAGHTAHPAGDAAAPQCAASVAEHDRQAPPAQ